MRTLLALGILIMAIPTCGTIRPDGTVSVKFNWTPAPGAAIEYVKLCVYGVGCTEYPSIKWENSGQYIIDGLVQGVTYGWSVVSGYYGESYTVESEQLAFTTPASVKPQLKPPMNLQAIPASPQAGDTVRFTWKRAEPQDQLIYEEFVLGQARHNSIVSLASAYDIQRVNPDQVPEANHDSINAGDLAWYVRALFSGGIELNAPIHALMVSQPPPPAGLTMPISQWHAINYWTSYYKLQGSRYVDTIGEGLSGVDTLAALSGAEQGSRWTLNPCAHNPSGATGPYQLLGWLPDSLACAAWSSTKKAAELLFVHGVIYPPGGWAVWPYPTKSFYESNMRDRVWDGYSLNVHRVSSTCFQSQPCNNPVVDLSLPGSVSYTVQEFMGEYALTFRLFNQTPNVAVFTVMALDSFFDNYDIVTDPNTLWLPDWSGRVLLSPAIPQIMPNSTATLTVKLRPKVPGNLPPIRYRIYGENVGAGSLDLSNSAMGIVEGQASILLAPSSGISSVTGQGLNADIAFDHQGPSGILDAVVTVTGSGVLKRANVRISVSNDPKPRRYRVTAHLGRVNSTDPRGEWQAKARVLYKGKELASSVLVRAYLVS